MAGTALAFARAIGEFGSLVLISGNLPKTQVASLFIFAQIESGNTGGRGRGLGGAARDRARDPAADRPAYALEPSPWPLGAYLGRYGLRFFALGYLAMLLLIPVGMIFFRAFEHGFAAAWSSVTTPDALHAFYLTIQIARSRWCANTIFGVGLRAAPRAHQVPRQGAAERDHRPSVRDLAGGRSASRLLLLYGRTGWFGSVFLDNGIQILFAMPGMVLATIFVSLPFVVREVVPGAARDRRRAGAGRAQTLGANWWQTFWRITLPAIRWGVAYGVVLTTARALGEFGAVAVVSGRISGQTETAPLWVWREFGQFNYDRRLHRVAGAGADRDRDSARDELRSSERKRPDEHHR